MARNRMIKPEFWEDEKVGELSFGARLLFIGSLNYADDEGYIRWNYEYLNSSIFIYDNLPKNKIKSFMKELENFKIIEVLETKNHFFIAKIKNFTKHQKISHPQPTKFDTDFKQENKSEVLKNQSEIENNSVNSSGIIPKQFQNNSALKEVKEKLKEVKEKEKEKEKNGETPEPPFSNLQNQERQQQTANDQTTEQPNDQPQKPDKNNPEPVAAGFKNICDYLVCMGYPRDKAELVANLSQSSAFCLTYEHAKIFLTQTTEEIKTAFEALRKMKTLQQKNSKSELKRGFD